MKDRNIPILGQAPKSVLVVTPCGDTICSQTALHICMVLNQLQAAGINNGWRPCVGTYVHVNQNTGVLQAFEIKADAVLFIDSDMAFDPRVPMNLLARGRDIVGCAYRNRQPPHQITVFRPGRVPAAEPGTGVEDVEIVASGMLLVKTRVFRQMKFPWFWVHDGEKPQDFRGNDVNFCLDAAKAGFKVWCDWDSSRAVSHLGLNPVGL